MAVKQCTELSDMHLIIKLIFFKLQKKISTQNCLAPKFFWLLKNGDQMVG